MRELAATALLAGLLGFVSTTVAEGVPRPDDIPGLTLSIDLPAPPPPDR